MWPGRRGPTQFWCSRSRVVVSPGPFSGPSEGEDCWDLEVSKVVWVGFRVQGTVLMAEGGVWDRGVWLLEGGKDWLGLRLEVARLAGGVG